MVCDKNFASQKLKRKKNISSLDNEFDNNFRQMTHFFAHIRLLQMFFVPCYHSIGFYSTFYIQQIHILHKNLLLCWFVSWSSSKHWIVASFCCPFISSNVLKLLFLFLHRVTSLIASLFFVAYILYFCRVQHNNNQI